MGISIYDTPADAQFINTYERMPIEQMMQAGMAMQDRWDRGEATEDALDAALDIDVNQWRTPEKREAVGKFKEKINALMEETGGEYHKALPGLEKLYKELDTELKEGTLGGLQSDYQAREALKAKLEKMKDDKDHPMSEKKAARILAAADRTAKKSGKLQKDEYGTWTEGQYQGITPATQINTFERSRQLLKDLPLMDNEQLGAWLEGKGIPYVMNPTTGKVEVSRVGLPEGSYEAIDATIKGRGTPEQQVEFLQTVFANDPEYKNIIAEETMLAMSELDAAEELQPGIKENRLHDASTTDMATIQRLEEAGVDIYSDEGQKAILNATVEADIRNKLISAPITQAVQAYGRQAVTYERNKITPSGSNGPNSKTSAANIEDISLSQTVDFVTNTRSGIDLQEENINKQKEELKVQQEELKTAKENLAANPSEVGAEEVEELEAKLLSAELIVTAAESAIKSAYEAAEVIDPDTGEMITDAYIEERTQEAFNTAYSERKEYAEEHPVKSLFNVTTGISGEPTWEATTFGLNAKKKEGNRLNRLREAALDRAEEEGLWAVTRAPYIFTGEHSGPTRSDVGVENNRSTLQYYRDGGAGWSMVLNGSADAGLAAKNYIDEYIKESKEWKEGKFKPTGEIFVTQTNQWDNAGHSVYSIGVEGTDGTTKKVVSSFLITKGDAGDTPAHELALSLSDSDNPQYKAIGDQMLAERYLARHLRKVDLHNLKLDTPVLVPTLSDPFTKEPIKIVKRLGVDPKTAEFIAVVSDPKGTTIYNGAKYSAVIPFAGGEEDLYRKLYAYHTGATMDARNAAKTEEETEAEAEEEIIDEESAAVITPTTVIDPSGGSATSSYPGAADPLIPVKASSAETKSTEKKVDVPFQKAIEDYDKAEASITFPTNDKGMPVFNNETTEKIGNNEFHISDQEIDSDSVMTFFTDKGLTKEQAAGIAGNLQHESGWHTGIIGDGRTSMGLAQWHKSRLIDLYDFAEGQGTDPTDPTTQLEFIWHELKSNARLGYALLTKATTAEEAAAIFMDEFERPLSTSAKKKKRQKFASTALSNYSS